MTDTLWLAIPGVIIWSGILSLPWQPWRIREKLEAATTENAELSDVTVLVPARNEAAVIAATLQSVAAQGRNLRIILVDDQSADATVAEAERLDLENLTIIDGRPLEHGWSGKLWALHQGLAFVSTDKVLLLDADIRLQPGAVSALKTRMEEHDLHLVSLLAFLRMDSVWEKLLMPAFVFFFKLLYPFHLSNNGSKAVAAAAGGCILLRRSSLEQAGGFSGIRDSLIDDCALARQFRDAGFSTWTGLSHSALSQRSYDGLADIWNMVARTAYTQLRHSILLLLLCSSLMTAAFILPVAGLFSAGAATSLLAGGALFLMVASFMPTLRYYGIHPLWCAGLPLAGALYLLMTWTSAWRYWTGAGAAWKQRSYAGAPGKVE